MWALWYASVCELAFNRTKRSAITSENTQRSCMLWQSLVCRSCMQDISWSIVCLKLFRSWTRLVLKCSTPRSPIPSTLRLALMRYKTSLQSCLISAISARFSQVLLTWLAGISLWLRIRRQRTFGLKEIERRGFCSSLILSSATGGDWWDAGAVDSSSFFGKVSLTLKELLDSFPSSKETYCWGTISWSLTDCSFMMMVTVLFQTKSGRPLGMSFEFLGWPPQKLFMLWVLRFCWQRRKLHALPVVRKGRLG